MNKKINALFYTKGKFGSRLRETLDTTSGTLYSKGKYKTKIKVEELPSNYIEFFSRSIWYMTGYLKTSDIKDVKYRALKINHLFKDDYIYLSYDKPIQPITTQWGSLDYDDYDLCICGNSIIPIIFAVEENSHLDLSEVKQQVNEKAKWYAENYGDRYGSGDLLELDEQGNLDIFANYKRLYIDTVIGPQ
ncbi:MAG: hypothetical protein LUD40_16480 [Phocaeicola dorei]|nr:hypothetical protein [Phocaeicola dorei]